jgi:hypothetical protein
MGEPGKKSEPDRLTFSWRDITVETTKSLTNRSHKVILKNGKRIFH